MSNVRKFVKAVKDNEYDELEIYPEVHLITDVDSEPYIVTEKELEKQTVDDVLAGYDFWDFEIIEYDERNSEQMNQNVWHIHGFEINE